MDIIQILAQELNKDPRHVANVVQLLDEGNTIPFIARYRKELHGSMDDQLLRQLAERLQYLRNLEQRKGEIKTSIENQGKLTDELSAADDAYDRLIEPSLEREIRSHLTDQANEGAIHMFALNLKPLLMQPPVKGKVTMGLDPGYRMGCKVAVVDGTGKVLDTAVVYPTYGER